MSIDNNDISSNIPDELLINITLLERKCDELEKRIDILEDIVFANIPKGYE